MFGVYMFERSSREVYSQRRVIETLKAQLEVELRHQVRARSRGLAEAVSGSQFLVPRMVREQLQEAITRPLCVAAGIPQPSIQNKQREMTAAVLVRSFPEQRQAIVKNETEKVSEPYRTPAGYDFPGLTVNAVAT